MRAKIRACFLAALLPFGGWLEVAAQEEAQLDRALEQDFSLMGIAEGLARRGDFAGALKMLPRNQRNAGKTGAYLYCLLTFKVGNRQKALAKFRDLLSGAGKESLSDRDLVAACMRSWSALTRVSHYREAQLLLQALEASTIISTKENKAKLLACLAQTFCQEGDIAAAQKCAAEAEAFLRDGIEKAGAGEPAAKTGALWARVFLSQGLIAALSADHTRSLSLLNQARIALPMNDGEKDLRRQVLLAAARQSMAMGKDEDAEPLLWESEGLVDLDADGYKRDLEEIYLLRLQLVEKRINSGEVLSDSVSRHMMPRLNLRLNIEHTARDTIDKGAHSAVPVLRELGWIHKTESDFSAAEHYLNHAVTLVNAQQQPGLMSEIKYELAEIALFNEDFHRAATLYEAAIDLWKKSGKSGDTLVWTLNRLGTVRMAEGRYKEAEKAIRESIRLEIARLQHEKNGVRLISWSPSSGEESLMLPEMSTALSANDLRQLAMIMEPLCNSYCAQDRIKDAEAVSRQVLRMKESACGQDSEEVRGSMAQLAYVHMAGSEYDAAIEIYNKLLDSDLGSVRMRADSLLSRALCYDITGKADAAALDFKKARRLYKEYLKTSPDDMRIQWLVEDVDYQLVRKSSFGVRGKDYLAAVDRHLWKKEQSPLKVYIDDSSDTGFDAPLRARLKTAFQQWLLEDSKMWLQYTAVDNADEANIVIARVDNFDDLPSGAGGQTTYEYNEEGIPASGVKKVIIRMFCASPAADQLTARTIDRLYSLCLHEIGHALGLDGHSPNGQDIMYWKAPGLQLSARDTATLAKLYRK